MLDLKQVLVIKNMKYRYTILSLLIAMFCSSLYGQSTARNEVDPNGIFITDTLPTTYKLKLQRYIYKEKYILDGDTMNQYLLPEVPVYLPIKFKNKKQREKYNRLVYNIKVVLPLAQMAKDMIKETYETLLILPDEKSKQEHIKNVEKEILRQYTPMMKKLTYSQGKLLIKLIDRECNQTSYEIVKAFLGPARAAFYQAFAWMFKASLKKEYDPENDDKLVERIVVQIEAGLL